MSTIMAGNVAHATVVFTPSLGTVDAADVTARLRMADGTESDLDGIVETATNAFEVYIEIAEDDPEGLWSIRWESSSPSPRIVVEDSTTQFVVTGSSFAVP